MHGRTLSNDCRWIIHKGKRFQRCIRSVCYQNRHSRDCNLSVCSFKTLVLQSYVSANPDYRFCPHPSCTEIIHCPGARGSALLAYVPTVECGKSHAFCFGCGMDSSHQPVICPIAAKWMIAKEDSGTSQWIKVMRFVMYTVTYSDWVKRRPIQENAPNVTIILKRVAVASKSLNIDIYAPQWSLIVFSLSFVP